MICFQYVVNEYLQINLQNVMITTAYIINTFFLLLV